MPQCTYIAIDLKSFYASVECVERGLDALTTNLVVADKQRTDKTICLAVTPSLKAYGISGRARLFEVVQRVREVNGRRMMQSPNRRLTGKSADDIELRRHPDWAVDYLVAPPRMAYYIEYSARIYQVYMKYIAPEDIYVYSIDEVFLDVTNYLATYGLTAHQLAVKIIRDVLSTTGITATAGIGTNMYLAKVAMDIVAKHVEADADGVRIAELDEMSYREKLWAHRPLTSFWRIGAGIAERLERCGMYTMGDVARMSVVNEHMLYRMFGVNAELIIDHAWGWEPVTIADVKRYRPATSSLSSGQVLTEPYTSRMARNVVKEMAENIALDLLDKRLLTNQVVLTVGYDTQSLADERISGMYDGPVTTDRYGRRVPKHAHGTRNLERMTSSASDLLNAVCNLYDDIVNKNLLIRRITLVVNNIAEEDKVKNEKVPPVELDLFADYEEEARKRRADEQKRSRERRIMEATLAIKKRYGKNALLKGMNFDEGATARERNKQIGGHKA